MSRIAFLQDLLSSVFQRQPSEIIREDDRSFNELCQALLAERGEMAGNRISRSILARYDNADEPERLAFFTLLATDFDVSPDAALAAAKQFARDNSRDHLAELMSATEPTRQDLFRRLNRLAGATNRLVDMRRCLLALLPDHPELARVDLDFRHLFSSWFNRGFLVLREIDWHTPANVLEKVIAYEAVHAIGSWEALRERVEPEDRKCFAFFHPAMLDEPLIFVEVALMVSAPESIASILDTDRHPIPASAATSAVFYSISNCQKGLAGVSFGNSLIKQVVRELAVQVPALTTFRTLSPVPGFMHWLEQASLADHLEPAAHLARLLANSQSTQSERPALSTDDRRAMQQLVAHYLVNERREDAQPIDPVASFHLGNGATLDSILPLADFSEHALQRSAGTMVSYRYSDERINTNQEAYAQQRKLDFSADVSQLLASPRQTKKKNA